MKKYGLIITFLLLCTMFTAQAQLRFGIKAGLNLTNLSWDREIELLSKSNFTGFQIGPMLEYTKPEVGFGFDASILYCQRTDNGDDNITIKNIEFPFNLKYKFNILILKAYLSAGPYANFKFGDSFKGLPERIAVQYKEKTFGAGLNFGFGVELLNFLQVGANYQYTLTNDFNAIIKDHSGISIGELSGKINGWSISATLLF